MTTAKETADLALEILKSEPVDQDVRRAESLVSNCTTTTQALKALQAYLRELEDEKAAEIIGEIVSKMAVHEAETM